MSFVDDDHGAGWDAPQRLHARDLDPAVVSRVPAENHTAVDPVGFETIRGLMNDFPAMGDEVNRAVDATDDLARHDGLAAPGGEDENWGFVDVRESGVDETGLVRTEIHR